MKGKHTPDDIARLCSLNFSETMRSLSDQNLFEIGSLADIFYFFSGLPCSTFNYIDDSMNRSPLDESVIKGIKEVLESKQLPTIYIHFHDENNVPLRKALQEIGFNSAGHSNLVACHLDETQPEPAEKVEGCTVKPVDSLEELEAWCRIGDTCFQTPQGMHRSFVKSNEQFFNAERTQPYIAYWHDKPAGGTLLSWSENKKITGNYWWGTLPEYRNKGIMSQMVSEMLRVSKNAGALLSVAQCFESSVKMARDRGFREYGRISLYSS